MTNLSPAASSILQAFDDRHELLGPLEGNWQEVCLAAAIRAAADQVEQKLRGFSHEACQEIRAIATELEGQWLT
jgi:hypothetical protein